MRWTIGTAMLACALAVGGCAGDDELGPSRAELNARWEAQNVFPRDYKADLLAFLRTYLNDPTGVRNAGVSEPALKDVGPGKRYVACVRYNARNASGRYGGAKVGAAIYVAGKLDDFSQTDPSVKAMCKDAAFAPFPALTKLTR